MLEGINPDESCGFANLCDLEAWFDGYGDVLADAGYIIAVYTMPLPYVRWGMNQCLFLKEYAAPPRTIPIFF